MEKRNGDGKAKFRWQKGKKSNDEGKGEEDAWRNGIWKMEYGKGY
jgi:hypothetical protein